MNIIEADLGKDIYSAINSAKYELKRLGYTEGKLRFNNLLIPLSVESVTDDIAIIYNLMRQIR